MKELVCIICPTGCPLKIEDKSDGYVISGALCKRGEKYALQEMTNPMRSLQSTVKSTVPGFRRVAVKTSAPVPLKEIFEYMEEINSVVLKEKRHCGDIISFGLNDSDVNLIITERMD